MNPKNRSQITLFALLALVYGLNSLAEEPKTSPKPNLPATTQAPQPAPKFEVSDKPVEVAPIPSDGWTSQQVAEEAPEPGRRPWERSEILSFNVNGLLMLQTGGGGNSFTGQLAWTPRFRIARYNLRLDLGVALPKNSLGDLFLALNYEVMFVTQIDKNFFFDIGAGAQTFTGTRGLTKPIISGVISRTYDTGAVFNRLFLGYSYFFSPQSIHEIKLGLGFTF